ncbi:28S ribosomal protein S18b, mitochondrial-like [Penaeus japonicus]|uniref:28S ribosomal protein S18b, mitochondrial-like n=1 Tax=Penaeus japonicus TaxID=27405 RepID=UPI001C717827|nr:28S ribosomal protein S18b, mitochondrial-like [Penaeus japonicus]
MSASTMFLRSLVRPVLSAISCNGTAPKALLQIEGRSHVASSLFTSSRLRCDAEEGEPQAERDPLKDRSKVIPVETSMKYLNSDAYKTTYGTDPVWKKYRRNFKGAFAPRKTRKTCIRKNMLSTGNPCPICRDEYLVLDYRNVELLTQFVSPFNGEILPYQKTNLCQRRHKELLVSVEKARDYGLLTFDVPFREYNYSEYYNPKQESSSSSSST